MNMILKDIWNAHTNMRLKRSLSQPPKYATYTKESCKITKFKHSMQRKNIEKIQWKQTDIILFASCIIFRLNKPVSSYTMDQNLHTEKKIGRFNIAYGRFMQFTL